MRDAWPALVLTTILLLPSICGCSGPEGIVWPISGSTDPDWPVASTYGPRLSGGVYDFHRGIDIPTPRGTDILAIFAGEVTRIEPSNKNSGTTVQVRHQKDGATFFSVYVHLQSVSVELGDQVDTADVLGESGVGETGSAHLHFEIRAGGDHRESCVHPLGFLPYPNTTAPSLNVTSMDVTNPAVPAVALSLTIPREELDLNEVRVSLLDLSVADALPIDERVFNFAEWNLVNTLAAEGDELVDNPDLHDIHVAPEKFNTESDAYRISFTFAGFAGVTAVGNLGVQARATDVLGKVTEVSYP